MSFICFQKDRYLAIPAFTRQATTHLWKKNPHQHMLDFIHIIDVDKRRRKKITKESHQI